MLPRDAAEPQDMESRRRRREPHQRSTGNRWKPLNLRFLSPFTRAGNTRAVWPFDFVSSRYCASNKRDSGEGGRNVLPPIHNIFAHRVGDAPRQVVHRSHSLKRTDGARMLRRGQSARTGENIHDHSNIHLHKYASDDILCL